jgi:hypothetical protein
MILNSEFVSRVINELKRLSKDDMPPRRLILAVGRNKATTYMSQKLRDRSLYRDTGVTTTIRCFELKEDDVVKCPFLEFRRCNTLMKSKKPLPELINNRYGVSIFRVVSLDNGEEFDYADSPTSERLREFGNIAQKYYVRDGHLYIPNIHIKAVDVELITPDLKTANDVSACAEYDPCKSIWEYKFVCPDIILEAIIQETLQELRQTIVAIPQDENPNLDSNQKSQTKE